MSDAASGRRPDTMGGPEPAEEKTDIMGGPEPAPGESDVMRDPGPAKEQDEVMDGRQGTVDETADG